jgi:hypothetical protein
VVIETFFPAWVRNVGVPLDGSSHDRFYANDSPRTTSFI